MEYKGLENELEVHVGDLVFLSCNDVTRKVSGFVLDFNPTEITLSIRYPFNTRANYANTITGYNLLDMIDRIGLNSIPKKTYKLKNFDKYKVLESYRNR